jgi:hypothetical protein
MLIHSLLIGGSKVRVLVRPNPAQAYGVIGVVTIVDDRPGLAWPFPEASGPIRRLHSPFSGSNPGAPASHRGSVAGDFRALTEVATFPEVSLQESGLWRGILGVLHRQPRIPRRVSGRRFFNYPKFGSGAVQRPVAFPQRPVRIRNQYKFSGIESQRSAFSPKTRPVSDLPISKSRILKFHRADTRGRQSRPSARDVRNSARQRPDSWPLPPGNVAASQNTGTHPQEIVVARGRFVAERR